MIKHVASNSPGPEQTRLNFVDAVTRTFAFLTNLGFLRTEASPTIVRYRKGDVEADVYHGRQSFELGFEIGRGGVKFSMSELIRATDPETARQYRNFAATTQSALTEGLARLEGLAKRYGQQALQGDPEFFVALENQRKSWAAAYELEVLEGQLRPKAREAFRQGNYREAAELYERIRPCLTPAELKKLKIARERDQG
jgi:hypothetical protein